MIIKSFIAIGAGLISFLSPCVLPIIPGYISYITGKKLDEIEKNRRVVLLKTIVFSLGFSAVFISLGIAASFIGNVLIFFGRELRIAAGLIIILFSLNLLGIINFNFLNQDKRFETGSYKDNYFFPFLIGAAFAFGWTPCIGPVLDQFLLYQHQKLLLQWCYLTFYVFFRFSYSICFIRLFHDSFSKFKKRIWKILWKSYKNWRSYTFNNWCFNYY